MDPNGEDFWCFMDEASAGDGCDCDGFEDEDVEEPLP